MVRYSYSKLNQYNNCPFCFDLKYNQKLFIDKPSLAAMFGTLVHKILELETDALQRGQEINYTQLKDYFREVNIPKTNKYDKDGDIFGTDILAQKFPQEWTNGNNAKSGKSYAVKANDFMNSGMYRLEKYMKQHPELELVGAEIQFEYIRNDVLFYGFIDRVLRYKNNPNKYIIMDIKTKDHPFKDQELVTPLQFVVYCEALKEMYGEDIEIECFYDLPVIDLIQHAGTKGFINRGLKKIDSIFAGINAKMFAPNPSPLCWYCSFRPNGPSYTEEGFGKCCYYSMWTPDDKSREVKMPWKGEARHQEQMQRYLELEKLEDGIPAIKKRNFTF